MGHTLFWKLSALVGTILARRESCWVLLGRLAHVFNGCRSSSKKNPIVFASAQMDDEVSSQRLERGKCQGSVRG